MSAAFDKASRFAHLFEPAPTYQFCVTPLRRLTSFGALLRCRRTPGTVPRRDGFRQVVEKHVEVDGERIECHETAGRARPIAGRRVGRKFLLAGNWTSVKCLRLSHRPSASLVAAEVDGTGVDGLARRGSGSGMRATPDGKTKNVYEKLMARSAGGSTRAVFSVHALDFTRWTLFFAEYCDQPAMSSR